MAANYVPFVDKTTRPKSMAAGNENGRPQLGPSTRYSVHQMVLPDDDDTSSVGADYDVASITSSIEDQLTWRGRMQVFLHSVKFQIFVLSLVILDALIVLFELLLDVGAFNNIDCRGELILEQADGCHYVYSPMKCGPTPNLINHSANITPGNGYDYCHCVYRLGKTVCRNFTEHRGVNPALVLHVMSLTILTTFLVEILLKLIAFRLKYFTHKFEVFDGFIVTISWILDVAALVREESFAQVATLIILLRLWRVVRIVNGAILSSKARSDDQLHKARRSARDVIHALHKSQDTLVVEQEAYNELKGLLEEKGIEVPPKPQQPVIPTYPYDKEEGIELTVWKGQPANI